MKSLEGVRVEAALPQSDWYVYAAGVQAGPFALTQIREQAEVGSLFVGDLVWCPAFSDWREASSVPGLFPERSPAAPAMSPLGPARLAEAGRAAGHAAQHASQAAADLLRQAGTQGSHAAQHASQAAAGLLRQAGTHGSHAAQQASQAAGEFLRQAGTHGSHAATVLAREANKQLGNAGARLGEARAKIGDAIAAVKARVAARGAPKPREISSAEMALRRLRLDVAHTRESLERRARDEKPAEAAVPRSEAAAPRSEAAPRQADDTSARRALEDAIAGSGADTASKRLADAAARRRSERATANPDPKPDVKPDAKPIPDWLFSHERESTAPNERVAGPQPVARAIERAASNNYIARHWRGELSLPVSFWINGVVLHIIALSLAVGFAFSGVEINSNYRSVFVAVSLFAVGFVVLTAWQMVGVWRAASRYQARGGATWGLGVKALVVLALANVAYGTAANAGPLYVAGLKTVLFGDTIGRVEVTAQRGGHEIEIKGPLGVGAARAFQQVLNVSSRARVARIDSPGGWSNEARDIGRIVAEYKLITLVDSQCYAACLDVFLNGSERWIAPDAKLGLAAPSNPILERAGQSPTPLIERQRRHLMSLGVPEAMAVRAMATPPSAVWVPTQAELRSARLITGIANMDLYRRTGALTEAVTDESTRDELLKQPVFQALAKAEPRVFADLADRMAIKLRQGVPLDEAAVAAKPVIANLAQKYLPLAADDDMAAGVALNVDYMERLIGDDPQSCVAIGDPAKGAVLRADLTRYTDIAAREGPLLGAIIASGSSRPAAAPPQKDVEQILPKMLARIEAKRPGSGAQMKKTALSSTDYATHCQLLIDLFAEALALPPREKFLVLRYLLAPR